MGYILLITCLNFGVFLSSNNTKYKNYDGDQLQRSRIQ